MLQAVPDQLGMEKEKAEGKNGPWKVSGLFQSSSSFPKGTGKFFPASRAWLSELFLSPRFRILLRFGRSTNTLTILSAGSSWLRKEKSGHPQWPSVHSGPWSQAPGCGGSWRSLLTVRALFGVPRFLSKALHGQHNCRQAFVPGVSISFLLLLGFH